MDNEIIEKYKRELMRMHRTKPAVAEQGEQQGEYQEGTPYEKQDSADQNGRLVVMVTAISSLYPVEKAKVTVFTGDYMMPNIIDTDFTDNSGKTKTFSIPAPTRELSMEPDTGAQPYTLYNVLVEADGHADNLHINLPVFRGVTSLQRSNLTPLASFGGNTGPIVFNELSNFNL